LAISLAASMQAQQPGSIPKGSEGADRDLDGILARMVSYRQAAGKSAEKLDGSGLADSIKALNSDFYYAEKDYFKDLEDEAEQEKYRNYDRPLAKFMELQPAPGTKDAATTGISAKDANGNFTVVGYGYLSANPSNYLPVAGTGHFTADAYGNYANGSYTWSGGLSLLTGLPAGTVYSSFTGVTPDGTMAVGVLHNNSNYLPQPFAAVRGAGFVETLLPSGNLSLPAGISDAQATSLSDDKTIVWGYGSSSSAQQEKHLIRWTSNGPGNGYTAGDMGKFPGSAATYSAGCSSNGSLVVGQYFDNASLQYSMVWTQAGGFVDPGANAPASSRGGQAFQPTGDGSYVVGYGAFGVYGYVWSQATGLQYLPSLTGLYYGVPQCVSHDGAFIGGGVYDPGFGTPTATIWTASGKVYNLRELLQVIGVDLAGWTLNQVTAIVANSDGTYLLSGNGTHNGTAEGFVVQLGLEDFSAKPYTFSTLAGLAGSSGAADGTGSAARFIHPAGVAVDNLGNTYVADTGNSTIRKIAPGGVVTTLDGSAGATGSADGAGGAARFNHPTGVAVDSLGNLYIADSGNNAIRIVTPGGVVTTLAGSAGTTGSADGTGSAARFKNPIGVAVDGARNVFVADTGNHTIRQITPAGVVTTLAGSAGNAGSVDGTGNAAQFNAPRGVAVDGVGNVFVADTDNHTIRQITLAGVVTTFAGSAGNAGSVDGTGSAARLSHPSGLVVDDDGDLVTSCDQFVVTISKVRVVETIAGLAGNPGSADGTGSAARFNDPAGVAADVAGNIYVADTDNHTIRWGALTLPVRTSVPTAGVAVGQGFTYTVRFSDSLPSSYSASGLPAGLSFDATSGLISGTPAAAGTFPITLGAINGAGSGSAALTLTVTSNFISWQQTRFTAGELADPTKSGPNAIYGLDGLSNLVKYGLGLEPKADVFAALPGVTKTATDWVYTYTRPTAITDVTYAVEVSTDLITWTTAGVTREFVSTSGSTDTWRARYPLASAPNVFFRLIITR
jgi:hypothetical protein